MEIMAKITVNIINNLRKPYSKYKIHPRIFPTAITDLVAAGCQRKKRKTKKKITKKTSAKT